MGNEVLVIQAIKAHEPRNELTMHIHLFFAFWYLFDACSHRIVDYEMFAIWTRKSCQTKVANLQY
jgi:hypothetical protein